jgi:hypothetical protein
MLSLQTYFPWHSAFWSKTKYPLSSLAKVAPGRRAATGTVFPVTQGRNTIPKRLWNCMTLALSWEVTSVY